MFFSRYLRPWGPWAGRGGRRQAVGAVSRLLGPSAGRGGCRQAVGGVARSRHSGANGYASLFQKTLRKGLFFCCLYVLDIEKKGPFWGGCQHFRKKRVFF